MNNQIQKVQNPMGQIQHSQSNAIAESTAMAEMQRVQAQMVVAKQFPRDTIKASEAILNDCTRPSLAQGAVYSYPRGGQQIEGASIRLAETIAQKWGNLDFGIRELTQKNGESTVEAYCWDMETNVRESKVFQVPHVRYSRAKGNTKLSDPRDIYELVANQGARRLRSCILGVIPSDIIESAVNQCSITLSANADTSPEYVKQMLEGFESYGVTKEQIEKRIGRRIDSILSAQILQLGKIFTSLKDGISTPKDWFEDVASSETKNTKVSKIFENKEPKKENKPIKNQEEVEKSNKSKGVEAQEETPAVKVITQSQIKRMYAITEVTNEDAKEIIAKHGFTSSKDITVDKYDDICKELSMGNV